MGVIAVMGVRGGVGATRTTLSLARELAPAVAVDLDFARGDLAEQAGIRPSTTLADLAAIPAPDVTAAHIQAAMYGADGDVQVAASPSVPEYVDVLTPDHIRAVLTELAARSPHVVVDVGTRIDVRMLAIFDFVERIVLVARAQEHSAQQIIRSCEFLRRCAVSVPMSLRLRPSTGVARWWERRTARKLAVQLGMPLEEAPRTLFAHRSRARNRAVIPPAVGARLADR